MYHNEPPIVDVMFYRGARIHSDSWGTDSSAYDALAYDVDLFAYVYQDFLPVFAAGNLGAEEVDSTVTSPSVAKNCMSVGELALARKECMQHQALRWPVITVSPKSALAVHGHVCIACPLTWSLAEAWTRARAVSLHGLVRIVTMLDVSICILSGYRGLFVDDPAGLHCSACLCCIGYPFCR